MNLLYSSSWQVSKDSAGIGALHLLTWISSLGCWRLVPRALPFTRCNCEKSLWHSNCHCWTTWCSRKSTGHRIPHSHTHTTWLNPTEWTWRQTSTGFAEPRLGKKTSVSRTSMPTTVMFYIPNSKKTNREIIFSYFFFLIFASYTHSV